MYPIWESRSNVYKRRSIESYTRIIDTTPREILTLIPVLVKCIRTSRYIVIGPVPDKPYS